jgi:hypothetical protein
MTRLIGSDASRERLVEGIKKFYGGTSVYPRPGSPGTWLVLNSKGPIPGVHVVNKKGRWRFESILEEPK